MESDPRYQARYIEMCEVYRRYKKEVVDKQPPFEMLNEFSSDDDLPADDYCPLTPPRSPYSRYSTVKLQDHGRVHISIFNVCWTDVVAEPFTPSSPSGRTHKTNEQYTSFDQPSPSKSVFAKAKERRREGMPTAMMPCSRYSPKSLHLYLIDRCRCSVTTRSTTTAVTVFFELDQGGRITQLGTCGGIKRARYAMVVPFPMLLLIQFSVAKAIKKRSPTTSAGRMPKKRSRPST